MPHAKAVLSLVWRAKDGRSRLPAGPLPTAAGGGERDGGSGPHQCRGGGGEGGAVSHTARRGIEMGFRSHAPRVCAQGGCHRPDHRQRDCSRACGAAEPARAPRRPDALLGMGGRRRVPRPHVPRPYGRPRVRTECRIGDVRVHVSVPPADEYRQAIIEVNVRWRRSAVPPHCVCCAV